MYFPFPKCPSITALALVATLFSFALGGCGGTTNGDGANHEIVYVHVFNGYPGASSLSLYGPSGRVVTNLPFGERTPEPVAINRNYGNDFVLVLDGASQTFPLVHDLYSLYPQETATIFVAQRQDTNASIRVFRHIQSISPACRFVMNNSLALQNEGLGTFSFVAGFDFTGDISTAGYDRQLEETVLAPEDQRPELYSRIEAFPFFAFAEPADEDDEDAPPSPMERILVWVGDEDRIDLSIDFQSGTITSFPPSEDYIRCLQEEEDEDSEDDEDSCRAPQTYNGTSFAPNQASVTDFVHYYPDQFGNASDTCDASFKLFSDFDNIFFGEHGHDGYNNNRRVTHDASFGISDHFFFVLYGRPVEPRIETWVASDPTTGGGFVDMERYPDE